MKFEINLRKRNNPKEDLIADLHKVAGDMRGNPITAAIYAEKGKFGVNTMLRRFGSWNKALKEAGLPINNILNIPDDELFENLADVWQKLGRQPVGKDIDKAGAVSKFSLGTYETRFGSWNKALQSFADFVNNSDTQKMRASQDKTLKSSSEAHKRSPRKINWRLRAQVLIRDSCICQMCGTSPSKDPSVILHVDHIQPWAKGGETVADNLQTLCNICNIGKSAEVFK